MHLRLVVEGLVPLGVLPGVLGGVKTVAVVLAIAPDSCLSHNLATATNCGCGKHSPLLSRCHGIGAATVEVKVPRDGADREGSGASGEGVVLPRRASTLGGGGGGGGALYHPIRQQLYQWASQILLPTSQGP